MSYVRKIAKRILDTLGIPRYWVLWNLEEFRMVGVRLYHGLSFQNQKIRALLKKGHVNLLFGCGETRYQGWTGIDSHFGSCVDLVLDLRRPLPFSDQSVDYCYSEHFLEHLFPDEGRRHIQEVFRVLRDGGVYRVVVPDAIRFAEKYIEGDREFFALAFPWAERPMQAIYDIFNWGGRHRNILDFPELELMAREAGFARVYRCEPNKSEYAIMRIDRPEPQRIAESLYVEMIKRN
jgi:predicted SAM-dependent methyltransferase